MLIYWDKKKNLTFTFKKNIKFGSRFYSNNNFRNNNYLRNYLLNNMILTLRSFLL